MQSNLKDSRATKRALAVKLKSRGYTYAQIESEFAIPLSTSKRAVKKFKETGNLDELPRCGRPSKLSASDRRSIKRSLRKKRTGSVRATASRLKRKRDLDVHPHHRLEGSEKGQAELPAATHPTLAHRCPQEAATELCQHATALWILEPSSVVG